MRKYHQLCLAAVVGAVTFAASLPRTVNAAAIQENAAACTPNSSGYAWDYTTGALRNTHSTNAEMFTCSFPSGSPISHSAVTYMSVSVYDGNPSTNAFASACVRDWSGSSYNCGASDVTSGTGADSLFPARTYWTATYGDWYAYISVLLPDSDVTFSTVSGFYASN